MNAEIEWLPDLMLQDDYDGFQDYLRAAYDAFASDFITSTPILAGREVRSKRHEALKTSGGVVITHGTDTMAYTAAALSYLIQNSNKPIVVTGSQGPGEDISEENRTPKIALIERIRWPRPIIEHVALDERVLAWTEVYRGRGTKRRAHLFLEDEGYVVVLDPRGKDEKGVPKYYLLWTTFLVDSERRHREMIRRYVRGAEI